MSSGFDRSSLAQRALVSGLVLAVVESVASVGLGFTELLSWEERFDALAAIASVASTIGVLGSVVVDRLGRGLDRLGPRRARTASFVGAALVIAPFLVSLTEGRRVRDLAMRPLLVACGTVFAAFVAALIVERIRRGESRRNAVIAGLVVVAAAVVDRVVLFRLYPAFHLGLALVGALSALVVGASIRPRPVSSRAANALVAIAVVLVVAGPFVTMRAVRAPNLGFVLEQRASVTGKLVAGLARLVSSPTPAADVESVANDARPTGAGAGIDLVGRDVLLVTVDALRADRLRAYGGRGLTPEMDRFASESAVFSHAYTTTPHTSYALASLLTGKYLRPIFELPNAAREHATLPERLRRYGYRTAAFYPPAIFFVDADRFSALEAEGFGFEYRKQMYAPAADRVRQVESYLAEAPADRRVFVWVHFFEPHEPYDPPPSRIVGEGDEARYDGEVAEVDAAFGALVRSFRARRPGATVILTADHGEEFGDHGGRYHGSTLYDEQVHVPLVWSSPDRVSPSRVDAPVEHVDLATTLLAALHVPRDARMRGDDLGPLLAGTTREGPRYAFADIAEQRMVVDGRWKAICAATSPRCELFDLERDPRERQNRAGTNAAELGRLRSAIASFTASIPRTEALALGADSAFPEELARAELGDRTAAPALVPLLESPVAEVRANAARLLAKLDHREAQAALDALAERDADANVRAEAAISAFALGAETRRSTVRELALRDDVRGRRAALALGRAGDPSGADRLATCVSDVRLDEVERRACVLALGTSHAPRSIPALVSALDDVRLRNDAADALATLGDRAAASALASHLAEERYVPSRVALARALHRLGDRRFEAATRRYLGMASGMPGGVALLLEATRLAAPGARGGDLRGATLTGFSCDAGGCAPRAPDAHLPTGAASRSRVVVLVDVLEENTDLQIGSDTARGLGVGLEQRSVACDGAGCANLAVRANHDVRVVGYVVVPEAAEIPAPPPEPWDAGTDATMPAR